MKLFKISELASLLELLVEDQCLSLENGKKKKKKKAYKKEKSFLWE